MRVPATGLSRSSSGKILLVSDSTTTLRARDKRRQRCPVCKARGAECFCSRLPRVPSPLPLLILQHVKERFSQSNTGNLLPLVLEGCTLASYGDPGRPLATNPILDDAMDPIVLFPLPDSPVISRDDLESSSARGPGLVVLDATWRQARRMLTRVPVLRRLRFRRLPEGAAPRWRLREPTSLGQVGTAEAVAWALEAMGFVEAAKSVWDALDLVGHHVLSTRGRRNRPLFPD